MTVRATPRPSALPALGRFHPFPLPPLTDEVLSNGLRVVTVRAGAVELAEIRLFVPLPAYAVDPAAAEVLTAVTARDCARRVTEGVDGSPGRDGSLVSVAWTGTWLALNASVPVDAVDWALGLLARSVTDPVRTARSCQETAGRLAAQAHARLAHPLTAAHAALHAHTFPGTVRHPEPAALRAVSPADVAALHRTVVRPRGAFLVVVAPVDTQEAVASAFRDWPDTGPRPVHPPPVRSGTGVRGIPHRGAEGRAQVMLAAPALPRTDSSFPALSVTNCLFGGYFSARLAKNLREHRGLVYKVESTIDDSLPRASVLLTYATDSATVADSLGAVGRELRDLIARPPDASEIDAAREHMIGITCIGQTSQSGLASALVGVLGHGLGPEWLTAFPAQLREVTGSGVAATAERLYHPDRFTGVVLGAPGDWTKHLRTP
ncbi:M16 family metallopeptidase [Streptomyces sp. NPDC048202]|uniref:M16 family metallopeptidase n=1 Tax=Streptomyces sp. NPDC048202 TaxID=3365514 RepID=UPI00371972B4